MRRFISVFMIAAVDENHIASRYAKLLERLWVWRDKPAEGEDHDNDVQHPDIRTGDATIPDSLAAAESGMNAGQLFWGNGIGLQPFLYGDSIDTLFPMPSVFPMDQPGPFGTSSEFSFGNTM